MSFFGLNTWKRGKDFPHFNITNLFKYAESVYIEKLKCIFHYFYTLATEQQKAANQNDDKIRTISIYRHIPSDADYAMLRSSNLIKNKSLLSPFKFCINGNIESCANSIQIDFANKYIGGGVLRSGCVQEEIRFLLNCECLVSLLFCERMKSNEAIAIVGTRQFAKYKGYGSSFEFDGPYNDQSERKEYGKYYKLRNCIVAIDAEKYFKNVQNEQYKECKMKRELLKCFCGFSVDLKETNLDQTKENDGMLCVASGNWGCGVFGGDIELKCIIQWIGVTLAKRKMKYFGFGDKGCQNIESFVDIMQRHKVNVGDLWKCLCEYAEYRKKKGKWVKSVMTFVVERLGNGEKLKQNEALVNKKYNNVDPNGDVHMNDE